MYYLDTSALVAFYCPEPISDLVEEFILQATQPAISALTEVELFSAVSRKIRENFLSREDGNRIINQFEFHKKQSLYQWLPLYEKHYQTAKAWIAQFIAPLKTLDALHLAVASLNNLKLITSDKQLYDAAKLLGIEAEIFNISSTKSL